MRLLFHSLLERVLLEGSLFKIGCPSCQGDGKNLDLDEQGVGGLEN